MRMDHDKLDADDLRREGGEEMEGMTLMLPRFSRKGKLYAGMSIPFGIPIASWKAGADV
jgi:hypothetical protein